jgi:hypothetical protein
MHSSAAPSRTGDALLVFLCQDQPDLRQQRLVYCNIVYVQRMAAERTRNIWLLMVQLREHSLEQAALAEGVAADSANRLPEWIPADRAREIGKCRIIHMLPKLTKEVLWCFQAAYTQSR